MALDEFIFSKVSNYFRKKAKVSDEVFGRSIFLDSVKEKLTVIARAITGDSIELFHAEREGGYKDNSFFLPTSFCFFNSKVDNYNYYIFRVLYLSTQRKLNLNYQENEEINLDRSRQLAMDTSGMVLEELIKEFPITEEWHNHFLTMIMTTNEPKSTESNTIWLYGKWMRNSKLAGEENKLENIIATTKKANADKIITTINAKAIEDIVSIAIDKKQQEDYVLTHNFEKVDTAEEFDGVWRDFDGDDDLKDHQEALDELNMKFTVRVDDTAHSVYQADFIENTTISESAEIDKKGYHLKYKEWDFSKKSYKEDFCKLYPTTLLKTDINYYKSTITKNATTLIGLRKMLATVNNKVFQQNRQTSGDEFDIDALTDLFVDVRTKHTPSENIYITKRKKEKDISILLLLDISLSSDGYSNGNRIIDVVKQVSILFGEILNEYNVDFSINSFYSKTRNFSTYQTIKGFDEDWNRSKYVIGALEPDGYTRMGVALRHSGALLSLRESRSKWVILITDGKPNDFDKYEGKYGIYDVKQALHELNEANINTYALAIEAQAKYYLPQMLGNNNYQILTSPIELLKSLVKLVEKIRNKS